MQGAWLYYIRYKSLIGPVSLCNFSPRIKAVLYIIRTKFFSREMFCLKSDLFLLFCANLDYLNIKRHMWYKETPFLTTKRVPYFPLLKLQIQQKSTCPFMPGIFITAEPQSA